MTARARLYLPFVISLLTLMAWQPSRLIAQSQSLKKFPVGSSGCTAMFPAAPQSAEEGAYAGKNMLYSSMAEWQYEGKTWQFGVKVLKLNDPEGQMEPLDQLEAFMDYFKSAQGVMEAEGYKKTGILTAKGGHPGLSDTWTDHAGNQYVVTGWTTSNTIAVLFIYGEETFPVQAMRKAFLNGIRFPEGI